MNLIEHLDKQIERHLTQLTTLVEQQRNPEFIKVSFKHIATLVAEKHSLLLDQLLDKKSSMPPDQYNLHKKTLIKDMQTYLFTLAYSTDRRISELQHTHE